MSSSAATDLFREGLLEGVGVVVAGAEREEAASAESFAAAVQAGCRALGAQVAECLLLHDDAPELQEQRVEATVDGALQKLGAVDLLVVDGDGLFAAAGALAQGNAREALVSCMDLTWSISRALAGRAFIANEAPGRIVYVAPAAESSSADDGHGEVVRAALENLSRTLSIEWARYGITPLTIAPGASTSLEEVASLVAYLASPAGAYFSGCLLDLGGPTA